MDSESKKHKKEWERYIGCVFLKMNYWDRRSFGRKGFSRWWSCVLLEALKTPVSRGKMKRWRDDIIVYINDENQTKRGYVTLKKACGNDKNNLGEEYRENKQDIANTNMKVLIKDNYKSMRHVRRQIDMSINMQPLV